MLPRISPGNSKWCGVFGCLPPLSTFLSQLRPSAHTSQGSGQASGVARRASLAGSEQDSEARLARDRCLGTDRSARAATARKQHCALLRKQRRQRREKTQLICEAIEDIADRSAAYQHTGGAGNTVTYWQMVSFYSLSHLDDPDTAAERLRRAWAALGILGRVYLAREGINAQLAVPDAALDKFKDHVCNDALLSNVFLNFDVPVPVVECTSDADGRQLVHNTQEQGETLGPLGRVCGRDGSGGSEKGGSTFLSAPFAKLSIKVRPHVLADGLALHSTASATGAGATSPYVTSCSSSSAAAAAAASSAHRGGTAGPLDWTNNGRKLSPQEFHQKISACVRRRGAEAVGIAEDNVQIVDGGGDSRPIVLDIRNRYETDVGRFEGAVALETDAFRDAWRSLDQLLLGVSRDREILTYCTGECWGRRGDVCESDEK